MTMDLGSGAIRWQIMTDTIDRVTADEAADQQS